MGAANFRIVILQAGMSPFHSPVQSVTVNLFFGEISLKRIPISTVTMKNAAIRRRWNGRKSGKRKIILLKKIKVYRAKRAEARACGER
jgi:hypothetical protein